MKTQIRVREVAQAKKISITKLSQRSEVSYSIVRRMWYHPSVDVSIYTLQRLADVLQVNVSELITSVPDEEA